MESEQEWGRFFLQCHTVESTLEFPRLRWALEQDLR